MLRSFYESPIYLKISAGVFLVMLVVLIFTILNKGDSAYDGIPLSKNYDSYADSIVSGTEVVRVVQTGFTESPIVIFNEVIGGIKEYGPVVEVQNTEVGNYCGYPSILGHPQKDMYQDEIGQILNSSSKEYINREMKYQSYHICNENGTVVGVYFQQLRGR